MQRSLEAVAEPTRRRILELLREDERPVGELVHELHMSQPAVSKHLRVLREAGLVHVERDAQRRRYRLNPEPLVEIADWLTPFREGWARRLDDLAAHLDVMEDR